MPSSQSGSVFELPSGRYGVRYYDETGKRCRAGDRHRPIAFRTKTEARAWLRDTLAEVAALRSGELVPRSARPVTVDELLDTFLDRHGNLIDPATKRKLTSQLKHARTAFGDRSPDSLGRLELEDWRATLSPGAAPEVFRAFRQALSWALARSLTTRDATAGIRNPKRRRHERQEVTPFETWAEVEAVAAELDPRYAAIPLLGVGTGLRPEELFGLHRADIDRAEGVLHVCRRFTGGMLKEGGKTPGSVRTVPLRGRVVEALDAMPRRIDTPILFPAPRGGYIDVEKFRHREWAPALRAAGVDHRRVVDMRHTFATWSIDAKVELWYLARLMGTSVVQLEDTYARWLKRTDDQLRAVFDAYDSREVANG